MSELIPYKGQLVANKTKISCSENLENFKQFEESNEGGDPLFAFPFIKEMKTIIQIICSDTRDINWHNSTDLPTEIAEELRSIPKIDNYFRSIRVTGNVAYDLNILYGCAKDPKYPQYDHLDNYCLLAVWGKYEFTPEALEQLAIEMTKKSMKRAIKQAQLDFENVLEDLEYEAISIVKDQKRRTIEIRYV